MADTDEFKDALPAVAARLDALRAAGLRGLDGITEARRAAFAQEKERLAKKLGPDHPRVAAMAARVEAAATLGRTLIVEVARAETVAPVAGAQEWGLHGYVRWADLSPAAGVTVSLVDARGQWLQGIGYACTDERGYFRLTARVEHAADGTAAIVSSYVRVTDAERKELHRGSDALSIVPGAVEYREIVLDGGGRTCVPPDESVPAPGPAPGPGEPPTPRGKKPRRPS